VQPCVGGCGKMENVDHLIFSCDYFCENLEWYFAMVSLHNGATRTCHKSLTEVRKSNRFSQSIHLVFNSICLSCAWVIWNERNVRVFRQNGSSIQQLLDKIKIQSFWWLKAKRHNLAFTYHL